MADPVEPGALHTPPPDQSSDQHSLTSEEPTIEVDNRRWSGWRRRGGGEAEPELTLGPDGRRRRPLSARARRQRRIVLGVLAGLFLAAAAIAVVLQIRSDDGPPAGKPYDATQVAELEARAAAGLSHVVYARSPTSAAVTAKRVATYRARIEDAVKGTPIPADLVESIVFIESGGRPDVIAGAAQDPQAASGLTQIVASTATDFLDMRVDLAESRRLTKAIARARREGDRAEAQRLTVARRRIDDRFDPVKALRGTVRYLEEAYRQLGRMDLAVTSYHMGIGNLSNAVRAFDGSGPDVTVAGLVKEHDLSYVRLYFGTSPLRGAAAWKTMATLADDSSNYYWKVIACREILRLYRLEPQRLNQLVALHGRGGSAERVLHPAGDVDVGAARPETVATAAWMQAVVSRIRPDDAPLEVLKTAGWVIEVRRRYASDEQAVAFQYVLDRLTALNLISWERRQERIRITVSTEALMLADPRFAPAPA